MRSWPFVISAFVHIGLFSFFFFKKDSIQKNQNFAPVEITVVDKPVLASTTQTAKSKTRSTSKSKSPVQLFPSYGNVLGKVLTQKTEAFTESGGSEYYPEFDSAAGMSVGQIGSIQSLWSEVDKVIEHNPYLSEFGYTGTVSLRFELTNKGLIVDNSLRVDAKNPILKVIALRALRKALKNEKNELRLPPGNIVLTTQFTWSDYQTCRRLRGIYRKTLSFCNYAENKINDFTKSEKAMTYLKSLSYGFGAMEEIEKYHREEFRKKAKFDPFEQYRRDPDWTTGS